MTAPELVVYGATAAGVMAAVAAARHGVPTRLLEPGRHIGGMTSGGLGYTDLGDPRVLGGLSHAFYRDVAEHYGTSIFAHAGPEPHVAEAILTRWLERAGVDVVLNAPLETALVSDGAITEITAAGRHVAGVFIDASYEGDLLAAAGASYRVGREDQSLHGESLAGRREHTPGKHNFPPYISPFAADGQLLPQVHRRPLAPVGAGDGGVMAYGYRVCLSPAPDRIPFAAPPDYDPADWELARRYFAAVTRDGHTLTAGQLVGLEPNLPGGKCDGNSLGPVSLNVLDGSQWGYPDADPPARDRIRRHHLRHTQSFFYFLTHDRSVPAAVRDEMSRWGLPADEFVDTAGWPHQLYVREARRMIGEYVLTEHDLREGPRRQADAVAMGSYHIDIREVQRTWMFAYEHPSPIPMVFNEGYLSAPVRPYQIPYRCLTPQFDECRNLLVPVCVSASHVAFASLRMEVQYQMLGAAAGTAARIALTRGVAVQQVPVGELQQQLADQGQVLAL
jgi:hypothetical protein